MSIYAFFICFSCFTAYLISIKRNNVWFCLLHFMWTASINNVCSAEFDANAFYTHNWWLQIFIYSNGMEWNGTYDKYFIHVVIFTVIEMSQRSQPLFQEYFTCSAMLNWKERKKILFFSVQIKFPGHKL